MENNSPKLTIDSSLLWSRQAFFQELIFWGIAVLVYGISYSIKEFSLSERPALILWLDRVNGMFIDPGWGLSLLYGALAGILLAGLFYALDALVGLVSGKNVKKWVSRQDFLLPKTSAEKKWALIIGLMGSSVEEIIFRIYIFLALLPLWSGWLWAACLLSAVFTLLHAGLQGFWSTLWIFCISLFLCAAVAAGQSFYFIAAVHICVNLSNIFIFSRPERREGENENKISEKDG